MKWACCGLLWVVCLSIIMGCNADNNSEYERLQAEYVLPASALVEEVTNSRLPASRPKAPKGGWKMCTYKTCMSNRLADAIKTGANTTGVLEIEIIHKPIKKVTAEMLTWMFGNLATKATWYVDKKTYPIALMLGPVDNCDYTAASTPLTNGTNLTLLTFPATGCNYTATNSDSPWTCPAKRTGFTKKTKASVWKQVPIIDISGNYTGVARYLDKSGHRVVATASAAGLTRTILSLTWSWKNIGQDVQVTTQIRAGLMQEGSDTEYDELLGAFANPQIIQALTESTGGDLTRFATAVVLQNLQYLGYTSTWLPGVYKARKA